MRDRINILFSLVSLESGGSENVVLELASRLDPARFKCFVTAFFDGSLHELFADRGIGVFVTEKRSSLDIKSIKMLSAVIRDNDIDIVNSHHLGPLYSCYWAAKVANRKVLVHTSHSCWEMNEIPWYWKPIQRYLFHRADGVVGVVEEVAEDLHNIFGLTRSRIRAIPNAIDFEPVLKAKKEREAIRAELGIEPDEIAIGLVGNLREEKNHKTLIEAAALLREQHPQITLIFAGSGALEDDLRSQARELGLNGKVNFLGYRSDTPRIYAALDIYCLPSKKEGLSLSLLTAMAAGLPVVASDVPANRKLIEHQVNGLLASPDSPAGIAHALSDVITHPESTRRMALEAMASIRANHNIDLWVKQYERLFTSLVPIMNQKR